MRMVNMTIYLNHYNNSSNGEQRMLKSFLAALIVLGMSIGSAFAEVDVNKADRAALDGVKGIGPAMAKAILDARKKGGAFRDWEDFQSRVKGVGEKNSDKLSASGLKVNGQAKWDTAAPKMSINWTKADAKGQPAGAPRPDNTNAAVDKLHNAKSAAAPASTLKP